MKETRQREKTSPPSPGLRIVGAICGAVLGLPVGIVCLIVVYNVTDTAVDFGWRNSMIGGVIVGSILGVIFPRAAQAVLAYGPFPWNY